MSGQLFTDFLHDAVQYEQAERFWQDLFGDVTRSENAEHEWTRPWLATRFADGTPFGAGNPIFSAWSPDRKLGIRVIQSDPSAGASDFESWMDEFASDDGPIKELVISCSLSDETASRARGLIQSWISRRAQAMTKTG